jgi:hypothetical protein
MLERIPADEELQLLLGTFAWLAWNELHGFVKSNYNFEPVWDNGGKNAIWEVKYRRSGKTLCAYYVKEGYFTVLVVFGKVEREKFLLSQTEFCSEIIELYNNTHQYHDGKWLWINVTDRSIVEDVKKLIIIKKKPNTKTLD